MLMRARRLLAAIATFAILFNAFASSLAAALLPVASGQICTSRADGAGGTAPAGSHAKAGHCPYCAPHAGAFAAPPPSVWRVLAPAMAAAVARASDCADSPRAVWSAAQPRAPPFLG
ncbi:MAG: hypothetical protein OHK0044_25440 [Burkholderiaceae bacterium]